MTMISDCCGVEMDPIQIEHGICPCCGEHCEVVNDEDMDEPDYIPGVDDGEWGEAEEEG